VNAGRYRAPLPRLAAPSPRRGHNGAIAATDHELARRAAGIEGVEATERDRQGDDVRSVDRLRRTSPCACTSLKTATLTSAGHLVQVVEP
jgi:hypothetical protein